MKYYKELAELGCFSQKELVQLLGSGSAAASLAAAYLKKGYVERIRRDLYATVSMETGQPIPTRYQIASKLAEDAYRGAPTTAPLNFMDMPIRYSMRCTSPRKAASAVLNMMA